jgi:hypothetical protein
VQIFGVKGAGCYAGSGHLTASHTGNTLTLLLNGEDSVTGALNNDGSFEVSGTTSYSGGQSVNMTVRGVFGVQDGTEVIRDGVLLYGPPMSCFGSFEATKD